MADDAGQPAVRIGPDLLRLFWMGYEYADVPLDGKVVDSHLLLEGKGVEAQVKVAVRIERIEGLLGRPDLSDVPNGVAQRLQLFVGRFLFLFDLLVDVHSGATRFQPDSADTARAVVLAEQAGDDDPVLQDLGSVLPPIEPVVRGPSVAVNLHEFALLVGPHLIPAKVGPGELSLFVLERLSWQHLAEILRVVPQNILSVFEPIIHDAADGGNNDQANL